MATGLLLRGPLKRLAGSRPSRTFGYEFAWRSPVTGLGACHALEIGFVFGTLRAGEELAGPGAPSRRPTPCTAPGWPSPPG